MLRALRDPRALIGLLTLVVSLSIGLPLAPLRADEVGDEESVRAEETVRAEASPSSPSRRIAAAEAHVPALFSASLPLSRLADMPPRAPIAVRQPVRGLDWMRFDRPRTIEDPRFGSGIETLGDGSMFLPNWSTDSLLQETPDSAERSDVRRWDPQPLPLPTGVSPALLALEAERSELLRSLRPSRLPGGASHSDIFRPSPTAADPVSDALWALGEKLAFRELRRYFRQELKRQFEDDPSFRIDDYLERRVLIGQLGRGGRAEDLVIEERATEIRNEFLSDSLEDPERDVPIIQWGPLILDDRGGVNVDVLQLRETPQFGDFGLAPEDNTILGRGYGESILFPNERYRIRSKMKLNPDLREVGRDWGDALGKLSASVEIDWRAPVLTHKSFSTELGGSIDADGRFGVYLNLVIYGK